MEPINQHDLNSLVKTVNSNNILNKHLQQICVLHGLSRTGVKADLQRRIVGHVTRVFGDGHIAVFNEIRRQIYEARDGKQPSTAPFPPAPPVNNYPPPLPYGYGPGSPSPYLAGIGIQTMVAFKPSPFYEDKSRIGDVKICEAMSQHRNSVLISFKPQDYPDVQRLVVEGRSHRIFVFCAGDMNGLQDITFPHQSELKVNGEDVRANLRGLKNKPGSTRPVDITNYLRCKHANYMNQINFTYALTSKKFYLVVKICKVIKVEELVARIQAGPRIRKSDVVNDMLSKAKDVDIEATSQVMSLKCPLSYMRLSLPCRGMGCKHVQCFDATSYLQLQEQGPQWLCPVCSNPARFEQLAVDEYVLDILSNTLEDLDQVTIEPDGQWKVPGLPSKANEPEQGFSVIDDLEVSEVKPRFNINTPTRSTASIGTPSIAESRESTALPRGQGHMSAKRPAPVIIDLTLDSDDEDTAPPPPKRQQLNNNYLGSSHPSYY